MKIIELTTAACLIACSAYARCARASFIFNVAQSGSNILINGAGSVNLSSLAPGNSGSGNFAGIEADQAFLDAGPYSLQTPTTAYSGLSGPSQFGSGTSRFAATGTGDAVGVVLGNTIILPTGYISGSTLADSDTIVNESYSFIGLTPGTYVYTWGNGATADSLTINVLPVPEPASAAMIAVPATIAMLRRRRRMM